MKEEISWIYFLSIEEELPPSYYKLAKEFLKNGYSLVPIKLDQISHFYDDEEFLNLVCSVESFSAQMKFKKSIFARLNYYIVNKKINLFHISSFQVEKFSKKQPCYFYFQLPCPTSVLVYKIKDLCETLRKDAKVWPGGRRAKIPV